MAKETTDQEEKEPGRRMPPPSSPVPRLSSVPSAASTFHTIASSSPLRQLLSALREKDGRTPRPLLGDAIATTSPPHRHRSTSSRAAPRRFAILPASSTSPPSSPVPLFCLLPSPSTPSPVLPFRLRLRFLLFFALISSARSHLFALPSSCSSFLALLPAD